ncbi:MAG: hypothetical protein AAF682_11025 [Planctomycetota bacterium]
MRTEATTLSAAATPAASSALSRVGILLYGVASYAVGVAGLCWLIAASLGVVPFTGGPVAIESTGGAIAFNLVFIALFGLQHVVMARPAFKQRWTQVIPEPMERPTFVLITGILVSSMMFFWQPLPDAVWTIETPVLAWGLTGLAVMGWAYLFAASFAIDHFELFGLKQVWRNFRGQEPKAAPLMVRFMYRFDRHPIMTGFLLGLWITPAMTLDHLVLAVALSSYMVLGVTIEERTLVARHGEGYREYRRRVGALVPFPGKGK